LVLLWRLLVSIGTTGSATGGSPTQPSGPSRTAILTTLTRKAI